MSRQTLYKRLKENNKRYISIENKKLKIMENDMKDLKPIEEMISFWKEGGKYLSCPKCGFILSKEITIDDSNIYDVITCGNCSESWEVYGKLIGYKEYKEEVEEKGSE